MSKFKEKYGAVPDGLATLGYDSVKVLADAMKRAKENSPLAIRNALAETQKFGGVTGNIRFDENRNPVKSAVVMRIENGKGRYLTTIAPLIQQGLLQRLLHRGLHVTDNYMLA